LSDSFRAQDLNVFNMFDVADGENLESAVWEALAESLAVIALVPSTGPTANMMFEIGAARAWHKPVYALVCDLSLTNLKTPFANIPVYPFSRFDDVLRAIKAGRVLDDDDREQLASAYEATQVPVDRLLADPRGLESLVRRFRRHTGKSTAGEVLVSELLRMRKQGRLRPLKKSRDPQNAA
jgi:hypothetical protein